MSPSIEIPIKLYSGPTGKPQACQILPQVEQDPASACGQLYGLWRENCRVGPFRYSGIKIWYACFVDSRDNHRLFIWKTSNYGETWEIQHDGIFPQLVNEIGSFDSQFDSFGNIVASTQELNTGRVAHHKFSLSSNMWSFLNDPVLSSNSNGDTITSICQASSGNLVIAYMSDQESGHPRIAMKEQVNGVWSAETQLGHWGIAGTGFGGQTQGDNLERLIALKDNRLVLFLKAFPSAGSNSGTERSHQNIRANRSKSPIYVFRGGGLANATWGMGSYHQYKRNGSDYLTIPLGNNDYQMVYTWLDNGGDLAAEAETEDIGNSGIPSGGNNGFTDTCQTGIRYINSKYRSAYVTRNVGYSSSQVNYRSGLIGAWTPATSIVGHQLGVIHGGTNLGFDSYLRKGIVWTASFNDRSLGDAVMFNLLKEINLPSSPSLTVDNWSATCMTSSVVKRGAFAPSRNNSKIGFTSIILGSQTSLVGWYKLSSSKDIGNYNPIWGSDGANEIYYGSGHASGKVEVVKSGSTIFRSTSNIDNTNWHFLAIVDNGTALKAYLDNIDMGNSIGGYTSLSGMSLTRTNQGENGNNFNGLLDELLIFNRALSVSEISVLYNSGVGLYGKKTQTPWNSGLTLGYHFDELSGSVADDFSGNGHTGALDVATDRSTSGLVVAP